MANVTVTGWLTYPDGTSQPLSATFSVPGNPQDIGISAATITTAAPADWTGSIRPGIEFAADSWVHVPLAPNAELDPNSAQIVQTLVATVFATNTAFSLIDAYPLNIAGPTQPTVNVFVTPFDYDTLLHEKAVYLQSKMNDVPMPDPDHFQVQTCDPASVCDSVSIIYQPSTGRYYEFISMGPKGSADVPPTPPQFTTDSAGNRVLWWQCDWGGRMGGPDDINPSLATNPGWWIRRDLFPPYSDPALGISEGHSATAIPILAGLITVEDMRKQSIDHPIFFIIPQDKATYQYWSQPPAMRTDGALSLPTPSVAEGSIFRFPADLNFDTLDPVQYPFLPIMPNGKKTSVRLICEAIQKHGLVLTDTGGDIVTYMEKITPANQAVWDQLVADGIPISFPPHTGFPWSMLQCLKLNLVQNPYDARYV